MGIYFIQLRLRVCLVTVLVRDRVLFLYFRPKLGVAIKRPQGHVYSMCLFKQKGMTERDDTKKSFDTINRNIPLKIGKQWV